MDEGDEDGNDDEENPDNEDNQDDDTVDDGEEDGNNDEENPDDQVDNSGDNDDEDDDATSDVTGNNGEVDDGTADDAENDDTGDESDVDLPAVPDNIVALIRNPDQQVEGLYNCMSDLWNEIINSVQIDDMIQYYNKNNFKFFALYNFCLKVQKKEIQFKVVLRYASPLAAGES